MKRQLKIILEETIKNLYENKQKYKNVTKPHRTQNRQHT